MATGRLTNLWNAVGQGLADLLFPHTCAACGCSVDEREIVLCESCQQILPRTEHAHKRANRVEQMLADAPLKHSLVRGGAFCYYESDSIYRELLHTFKYAAYPQIGFYLGKLAATEFTPYAFFEDVDYVVPVPLHEKRLMVRKYNQAEIICEGLAAQTHIPMDAANLKRAVNSDSQTRKTATQRKANTQGIFFLEDPQAWQGKHILLVDDIITTGATLKACMQAMRQVKNLRVSVFTLGVTRMKDATKKI